MSEEIKENNSDKKNVKISPAVLLGVRYYQFGGDKWDTFIFYTGLVFVLVGIVFAFLCAEDYKNPLTDYEKINCLKYEQVYEEIFIPAFGRKQLTKVNRCVEYEVFE